MGKNKQRNENYSLIFQSLLDLSRSLLEAVVPPIPSREHKARSLGRTCEHACGAYHSIWANLSESGKRV
jgi:hypothetical protein